MASSIWKTVGDWITGAADAADKYKDIIKIGGSGAKAYLDYKNQKERNELEESAYNDYMTAAADAGQEAQAAVDLNLTPMTVTGVPTSKADVTDFTALAANGGIIGLRHGGRTGYQDGTEEPNMQVAEIPKDLTYKEAVKIFKLSNDRDPKNVQEVIEFFKNRKLSAKGGIIGLRKGGRPGYMFGKGPVMDNETDGTVSIEEAVTETEEPMEMAYNSGTAYSNNEGTHGIERAYRIWQILPDDIQGGYGNDFQNFFETTDWHGVKMQKGGIASLKKGGRVKRAAGGILDLGGREKDYRFNGGFVPIGEYEKKDDVPARLSKNEFVFTADAVRAAGGGSINKGAKKMYDTMKTLEAKPQAKRMTA
jgi:hypothetical protein